MSNSGKLALQLCAAPRASRRTTKLGASLPQARLRATRGRDWRGDGPGRGPGQQPERQRDPRVPGAPGKADREAGEYAGPERGRARGAWSRQGLCAPGTCLGRGSGARSVGAPVYPSPGWLLCRKGRGTEVRGSRCGRSKLGRVQGGDGSFLGALAGRRRSAAGRGSAVWRASTSAQAGPGAVCART